MRAGRQRRMKPMTRSPRTATTAYTVTIPRINIVAGASSWKAPLVWKMILATVRATSEIEPTTLVERGVAVRWSDGVNQVLSRLGPRLSR